MADSEDRQFAELVVAQGLCSREKVDECLSLIARLAAEGVTPLPRVGELLARKGYLTPTQVDATLRPVTVRRAVDVAPLPPEAEEAAANGANHVGRYVKVSRLGAGGMGEVWRAWDRDLRRWVALKFLHYDDPAQLARFRREAQTAASLNHPNIASVYEVGEANGKPFLAMQLVQGATLAALPRDDVRRGVALVRDAALAVHHAHEQGVIHRDLKPHNLMVEGSRVFVMDFGLAKPAAVDSSLSIAGSILGTPAYMPPEQARGDAARVGPRSDVYALGATLYDLLTGGPPFQDTEVYALLKRVVEEEPVPLRRRNARLDRELETIVMKCLEKDPGARYAGARELAEDLTRWLAGEAIQAHPPSWAYRVRKLLARRRAIVLTGAAVAVAAFAIFLPNWLGARSRARFLGELGEIRAQMLVVKEWTRQSFRTPQDIRSALDRESAKVTAFIARHPGLPQGYYVRAQGRLVQGNVDRAEEDLREALRFEPAFAPAWTLLARILLEQFDRRLGGTTDQETVANRKAAEPLLREAGEALRKGWQEGFDSIAIERWGLSRTTEDTIAETLSRALALHFLERRSGEAIRLLEQGHRDVPSPEYACWRSTLSSTREDIAAWLDIAVQVGPRYVPAYLDRGRRRLEWDLPKEAIADLDLALEIDPGNATAHNLRGLAWHRKGDLDRGLADISRATELDPRQALAWSNLSAVHLKRRDFERAERAASEAVRLQPGHPLAYANRAGARVERRDFEGAIADASQAIELDSQFALAWSNRAAARLAQGDFTGAASDVDRAMALSPSSPEAHTTRSGVRVTTGDWKGAISDATRALELDPRQPMAHVNRAGARANLGDLPGALEDCAKALELDPRSAWAYSNRCFARVRMLELDGALEDASRAIELDGGLAQAYVNRSGVWLLKDKSEKALPDAERAVALAPKMGTAWIALAAARLESKDADGAVAAATRAIELDPRSPLALHLRGLAHQARKDSARAAADFRKCLEIAPPDWPQRGETERLLEEARRDR